jgi:3-keto-disaccharide hydrolase
MRSRLIHYPVMKTLALLLALAGAGQCQNPANPFLGRWDLTVTSSRSTANQWMEIVEKDGKLDGRIQPGGGAVRPIVAARVEGQHLLITVSAAGRGPEVSWDLTVDGSSITGTQKRGDVSDTAIAGVRAPELKRSMPKAWSDPTPLFDGKDLAGWEPVSNPGRSKWVVENGTMLNQDRGSNIRTTRKFDDFKLHIEVNCPEHCNSGIYLRGRYEIQVGTEGGANPSHEMGAVYGYYAPAVAMPMGSGEWQAFDITLVGRTVTVLRNGTKIHDNQEMPGITGGALDSHEGEPGPIMLQGDHDGGMRYRNITISVPR